MSTLLLPLLLFRPGLQDSLAGMGLFGMGQLLKKREWPSPGLPQKKEGSPVNSTYSRQPSASVTPFNPHNLPGRYSYPVQGEGRIRKVQ